MRQRLLRTAGVVAWLVMGLAVAQSQPGSPVDTCPPFVNVALQSVGDNCGGMPRNSACYGYVRVGASFFENVPDEFFSRPSDRAELQRIASIQTAPLNAETEEWGVALLNVQANVPNTLPGQAVTFILLGDTQVRNDVAPDVAVLPVEPVAVVVRGGSRVNLRSGPGTSNNVIGTANPGQSLLADGQNAGGTWLRIGNGSGVAWVSRELVASAPEDAEALAALPLVDGTTGDALTPMQAFYFSTGLGQPTCTSAPDMLVIQGPQETRVDLTINGARVSIGSTIALFSERLEYGTLLGFGVQEAQLEQFEAEDDRDCLHTRMVVLDGDALLNDNTNRVPTGHFSQMVTCLNDDDTLGFRTLWDAPVRVPQGELEQFRVLESLPPQILRYPVRIPTPEEIEQSVRPPTPTPIPRPQATRPPQPDTPRPTTTPAEDRGAINCSAFRATSPPDGAGVRFIDRLTFFWDPIDNVQAYQVDARMNYGSQFSQYLFRVGPNITSYSIDLSSQQFGTPDSVTWFVQALVGAEPNFIEACRTGSRTNPIIYPIPD